MSLNPRLPALLLAAALAFSLSACAPKEEAPEESSPPEPAVSVLAPNRSPNQNPSIGILSPGRAAGRTSLKTGRWR